MSKQMKPVWCVAWIDKRTGRREWCATERGKKPSDNALNDNTRCGMVVILRIGSEQRLPTCSECLAKLGFLPEEIVALKVVHDACDGECGHDFECVRCHRTCGACVGACDDIEEAHGPICNDCASAVLRAEKNEHLALAELRCVHQMIVAMMRGGYSTKLVKVLRLIEGRIAALEKGEQPDASPQEGMRRWVLEVFGEATFSNVPERALRMLEEATELAQACWVTKDAAQRLVDYVYSRPVGNKAQEVGGLMVTLYALAAAIGVDADGEFRREFKRINTPEIIAKVRRRQAEKRAALVTGDSEEQPAESSLGRAALRQIDKACRDLRRNANLDDSPEVCSFLEEIEAQLEGVDL